MQFVDVSFGKKLGGAFGVVLVLLTIISLTSYTAIQTISQQTLQAGETNKLSLLFGEKLIDTMDWLQKINTFLMSLRLGILLNRRSDRRRAAAMATGVSCARPVTSPTA